MNTNYFSFAYQLQCNVVFFGKFNLVAYQKLYGGKQILFAVQLFSANLKYKIFRFLQDINIFKIQYFNCLLKMLENCANTQKESLHGNYSQRSGQPKINLIVLHNPHVFSTKLSDWIGHFPFC